MYHVWKCNYKTITVCVQIYFINHDINNNKIYVDNSNKTITILSGKHDHNQKNTEKILYNNYNP